ncbi:MAG TPA: type II toxin-antitoxin system VapC family toxin [Tepidiformaceae bacterium]|nr:type II toxin-antitoxin system VapC family toxin [Tepidiformaceae bacterium]
MRILLDSNALIWLATDPKRFSRRASSELADPRNALFLSSVVCAELAIRARLKRFEFSVAIGAFVAEATERFGLAWLPFTVEHAGTMAALPVHHGDPFDHMLIAQAISERLTIVTSDGAFRQYPVEVLW